MKGEIKIKDIDIIIELLDETKEKLKPKLCTICAKRFNQDDKVYIAAGKNLKEIIICEDCMFKEIYL